ncbi:hypothetical protein ACFY7C_00405 [Streptomyces sp. NPDC012769]|uniref:hypothetical protein n=1 Tax=Streptomyces sp. NPDC012769 TaxID=3364848 RepID=UPI00369DC72F
MADAQWARIEPLASEPADRRVEWETDTWSLGAEDEDRKSLCAAMEQTVAGIRERMCEPGFQTVDAYLFEGRGPTTGSACA